VDKWSTERLGKILFDEIDQHVLKTGLIFNGLPAQDHGFRGLGKGGLGRMFFSLVDLGGVKKYNNQYFKSKYVTAGFGFHGLDS
jgi:hypothetical protein